MISNIGLSIFKSFVKVELSYVWTDSSLITCRQTSLTWMGSKSHSVSLPIVLYKNILLMVSISIYIVRC